MSTDGLEVPERKMYITVDLTKFPGLKTDVDESVQFTGSGRVSSVRHDDYCNEMQIEVTKLSIPSHTHDSVGEMNEADRALGKMKAKAY